MTTLAAHIEGISLLGPGLPNWAGGAAVLSGATPYAPQKTVLPAPQWLPAAERRRSCSIVKLALAIGAEALAGVDAKGVPTVFASSGGDGENCHGICEMLASSDRLLSPTRFHNSVQNVTAGYWGIATGAMNNATVVCAYDGSFSAGLLEAMIQAMTGNTRTLLLAYDINYPQPLHGARPIRDAMGVALLLAPARCEKTIARLNASCSDAAASRMADLTMEDLRTAIPAARGLPLLHALANKRAQSVVLEYLDGTGLAVDITPC